MAETARSINDRLGAILTVLEGDTDAGATLPPLGIDYLRDLDMIAWRKENVYDEEAITLPEDEEEYFDA